MDFERGREYENRRPQGLGIEGARPLPGVREGD